MSRDHKFSNIPTRGTRIDVLDPQEIWSSGIVSSVKKGIDNTILVIRYDGWDERWNEHLPVDSKRVAPIYKHTARLKCLAKILDTKRQANLWPCVVCIRMVNMNNDKAIQDLAVEAKIFVEPSRPDLLPSNTKKLWKNGGMWIPVTEVKFWLLAENLENNSPPGFIEAYDNLNDDPTVPGYYNTEIFGRGTLVLKQFRQNSGSHYNKLVDFNGWKDKPVNMRHLNKIPTANMRSEGERYPSNMSPKDSRRSSRKRASSGNNAHDPMYQSSGTDAETRSTRTRSGSKQDCTDGDFMDGSRGATSRSSSGRNIPKFREPGDSELRKAIQIKDTIYKDYDISKSHDGEWIAQDIFRGNIIYIGKFPSQTDAKRSIDAYRLKAGVSKRKKLSARDEIKAKNDDMAAIGVEKAVSLSYGLNNKISDTGFSIHNWTLQAVNDSGLNDSEKASFQKQFFALKKKRRLERIKRNSASTRMRMNNVKVDKYI